MAKKTGSIKNYTTYYNKLIAYSNLMHITIYFNTIKENDGSFFKRVIYLDSTLTEKETLAVLLHELGHFIDEMINPKRYSSKRACAAYENMFVGNKLTLLQKKRIIEIEQAACNYGQVLAKKLKIKTGRWYKKEMNSKMGIYFSLKTKCF